MAPRLLLTRPDHLGDVLLSLPAATALRRALPRAMISYLVRPEVAPALERAPVVDQVLTAPFPPPDSPDALDEDVAEGVAAQLRDRFDAALVLRPTDSWAAPITAAAGIPIRVGFDIPSTRRYLTQTVAEDQYRPVTALGQDLAAAVAARFGATVATPRSDDVRIGPTRDDENECETALATAGVDGRPVVLHPGSGWLLKNWPATPWGRVAAALPPQLGVPVVTGTGQEAELVDAVVRASGGRAVGLTGRLSLGGLAALARRARVVVATDSGPLHLAALAGALVVGIYGPVSPAVFAPWCPPERFRPVWAGLACSPCGTLVAPPCGASTEPACIRAISVEDVLAAVDAVCSVVPSPAC